ncbi:ABC transporter ATP-binding protein [Aureimonas fodinaquatilis]|uniref:ABC transporter ATP-binding protein n=1 Tax=Aureimonas fodinaquatilis TaxID=2565783 RepID=A0A5B0DVI7_9HYPH|nr:ABC transporter ATP-binding protein [Aureimonas fodinaquatilis]KAA0970423.1 ABC transporter ATP-binding protein [Aureimonas fodinaquatilis]
MSQAIVKFEGVNKAYGAMMVVKDLNLEIASGQFVTLLGPSGCGKSTTLRMLGGFEDVSGGRILVEGLDVTRLAPEKRNTNMVFQDYALFPHMTVRQNIAFGLERKRWSKAHVTERVNQLLDMLRISQFADRRPDALSGGQRQRVALGRALAPDPAVVLLDEPLAALDAKLRADVQVELKNLQQQTGKTFIFVTHDQDEALTMSDRILVMRDGRIEQDGTPREIYEKPVSRFVAEFVGETNLLEGRVETTAEGRVLRWHGVAIPLNVGVASGTDGTVSIRPENLRVATSDMAAIFEGEVTSVIYRGDHQLISLNAGNCGGAINLRLNSKHRVSVTGEHLRLVCTPDDVVWLGAA